MTGGRRSGLQGVDPEPRLRDMPAPRKSKGMIAPLFGVVFAWPYRLGLKGLHRAGFRPWQLTVLSLVANGVIGWLILSGRLFLPGLLLIVAGLLDIFDGGLARIRGEASRWGAFLDSVMDRASDIIVFGCIFWVEFGQGHGTTAAFSLAALLIALLVSYVRAQAEALGLTLTEGFVQRLERYVALMIGLTLPRALLWVLVLLTVLGGLTAIQRVWSAWRQLPTSPAQLRRSPARRHLA
jgi:CDP-diacylglycerol--glycerol-3-phosphate 3-phosphatidyltransferase